MNFFLSLNSGVGVAILFILSRLATGLSPPNKSYVPDQTINVMAKYFLLHSRIHKLCRILNGFRWVQEWLLRPVELSRPEVYKVQSHHHRSRCISSHNFILIITIFCLWGHFHSISASQPARLLPSS
jgi:hypothetical protein